MSEDAGFIRRLYRKVLYSDIDKVYAKHFEQRQMPRKHKKALDVGMGFGFELITKFREGYDCFGFDFDKTRVRKTSEMFKRHGVGAVLKVGSATKIPFGSNLFDVVLCSHVIEHVKDDRKAVAELYRVLKKGGSLVLRVPNIHNLHTKFHMKIGIKNPYSDSTHVREYDRETLVRLVEKSGFKIKNVTQSGFLPPLGLKLYMVAMHYLPLGQTMQYLGEKFPRNAAEIRLIATK